MVVNLIELYYQEHPSGGTLHIVLDDGNYDSVSACLKDIEENNDFFARVIANILLYFTEEEIEQVVERPWEIHDEWW